MYMQMNKYIFIEKEKTATVTELRASDAYVSEPGMSKYLSNYLNRCRPSSLAHLCFTMDGLENTKT